MGDLSDIPTSAENKCHTWALQHRQLLGEWELVSGFRFDKWEGAK